MELISDPWAADFQNIRFSKKLGSLQSFSHRSAEMSTVVEGDITAILATDLHLDGHRNQMGEYLYTAKFVAFSCSRRRGEGFQVREQRMRQKQGGKVGLLARPASEVTCLPKEVPARHQDNLGDGLFMLCSTDEEKAIKPSSSWRIR